MHLIEDEEQRRKLIVELVKEPRIVDPATAHSEPDHAHNNTTVDTTVGAKRGRAAASTMTIAKKSVPPLSIVYVWRRFEADSLSEYLKASGVPGVAVYHAGIDAGTRARTQVCIVKDDYLFILMNQLFLLLYTRQGKYDCWQIFFYQFIFHSS